MKCKKALSLLLAAVMTMGMVPASAVAGGETSPYTDTNAEANKSYEYTVTGSDGSTQTVTVPAVGAVETGNSLTSKDVPGAVYYVKVTDPANANGEGYLLVDTTNKQAVNHTPGVEGVTIEGDRINSEHANAEWTVATSTGKMSFATGAKRLTISQTREGKGEKEIKILGIVIQKDNPWKNFQYPVELKNNSDSFEPTFSGDSFKLFREHNERAYNDDLAKMVPVYLDVEGTSSVLAVKDANLATSFTLFSKQHETVKQWTVDTTGLDALIAEAKTKNKANYEPDTWTPFEQALRDAEQAKADLGENQFNDEQAAKEALAKIDKAHNDLQKAMDALVRLAEYTPLISWMRTYELKHDERGKGALVTGVRYLEPGDIQKISWDWNKVKGLTTDSRMTVWDYGTEAQYANRPAVKNPDSVVKAATWNHRNNQGKVSAYDKDNNYASFRKFAGTFEWPAGYTLEDKAVITSVNDANYQNIYDYIHANPGLEKRFGGKKVIPVNDDMYVYVYREGEDPANWTPEEANRHLVFWTGTDGKGIWSGHEDWGGEWARKTPATYLDKPAVPAYHGKYPNNIDTGDRTYPVKDLDVSVELGHTDGWYTLVGTNTLMSTLNSLYPEGLQDNEKIHFDIYAFDNDTDGGMDQLEIKFQKAPATTAQVTVKYWLDNTVGEPLGTSVINGAVIGDRITLDAGTADGELNHYKAAAITKANADVTDGKPDYGTDGYLVKRTNNVINVVYTSSQHADVTYYTYDFGVTNQYTYGESGITNVTMETSDEGFSGAAAEGGKAVFSYTPQDATGKPAYVTLKFKQSGGDRTVRICVIPASNVLYEENFITGDWSKTNHTDMTVSDNHDNVYGHTAKYDASIGANGEYTAAVAPGGRTSDLTFKFNGIGLDLIGSCGPDYGTLMVKVKQGKDIINAYVVNTKFVENIHQVPLLHTNAKELAAGVQYDVTVRGINTQPAPAVMTMSADASPMTPEIYENLLDMGLTDADMDKVEFVNVADNLPANAPMLMSVEPAAAAGEQTVAVDSFRVYRSTEKAAVAYAENEKNLIYTNVMDEAITGDFSAYVEGNAVGEFNTTTYEGLGGPENELYLEPGTGIVFGTDATYAQVSLRAVKGATQANNSITLNHNTEMYYEVKPDSNGFITIANTGSDLLAIGNLKTNGQIKTIADKPAAARAVAMMFSAPVEPEVPQEISEFTVNFEMPDGTIDTVVVNAENSEMVPAVTAPEGQVFKGWQAVEIDALLADRTIVTFDYLNSFDWTGKEPVVTFKPVFENEPAGFRPELFKVYTTAVKGIFGKHVVLTVKTSTDVDYLMVNGQRVEPLNGVLVDLGLSNRCVFKVHEYVGKNETAAFEVVAYNAEGVASEVKTAEK